MHFRIPYFLYTWQFDFLILRNYGTKINPMPCGFTNLTNLACMSNPWKLVVVDDNLEVASIYVVQTKPWILILHDTNGFLWHTNCRASHKLTSKMKVARHSSEERNVLTTQQHLLIAGARLQGDRVNNVPQQQIWTELIQGCYVHSIDGPD